MSKNSKQPADCAMKNAALLQQLAKASAKQRQIEQQRDQLLAALKVNNFFLIALAEGAGVDAETTNIRVSLKGEEIKVINLAETMAASEAAIASVEQSSSSPAAGADGWIEWKGGECPVPDPVAVDVRFRTGVEDHGREAGAWFWINDGTDTDIVAYRVVQGGA